MKERLNSKKGKYLKSLFFVAMFVSIAYMVGLIAEAKGIKLSYDMVKQQKTNWCWAASAENSVRYEMKNPRTQKSAVNKIKGTTRDAYPNVGGTLSDIKKGDNIGFITEDGRKGIMNIAGASDRKSVV